MKKILLIIPIAALLANCTSSRSGTGATNTDRQTTASQRMNLPDHADVSNAASDTVVITGSQYVPIEGRSETGTRADIEGFWLLDSLNGTSVPGRSNINVEVLTPKIPEGGEYRHDSTTSTEIVNGVTRTTTTVLIDRMGTPGNKITPPQGANYHIPAKPSINFFGANETFSGFTGCNKFSGRYIVKGKENINLQSASASTKMVCIGDYDETTFLNTLKRVNSFRTVDGRLELLEGSNVLLVFSKKHL